ncbi:hypothetical protein Tco_0956385 [Tanacetum coccineum]
MEVPQSSVPSDNVADEAIYKELDDSLVRATTTASSIEVEQDSGGGPRRQETMGDTIAQTRFIDLEKTKTSQAQEITSLKRRVKILEKKGGSRTHKRKRLYKIGFRARVSLSGKESLGEEDASKQGRKIDDIDADEGVTLVDETVENQGTFNDEEMFDTGVLDVSTAEVTTAGIEVTTVSATITTTNDLTLAQALVDLKSINPKAKGIIFREPGESTTTTIPIPSKIQDKEVNIAWDDVQAKVEVDYQLAQRLQAQEQEELTNEEKERLFVQFLEQRRKHFAAKRAEKERNIPPTRAQQRSIMCTHLKNMEGWKPKSLKNKSFANIQELFDKAMKRVNTFVDYRMSLVE